MIEYEINNGVIDNVQLGTVDYGYMSLVVVIKFDSVSKQAFGTHDLRYEEYGLNYLSSFLAAIGKSDFCNLIGTPVRVKRNRDKIMAIGHYLNDKWFEPERKNC